MMDYQSFKDVVVEKILDFMPPEYANAIVEKREVSLDKFDKLLKFMTLKR